MRKTARGWRRNRVEAVGAQPLAILPWRVAFKV